MASPSFALTKIQAPRPRAGLVRRESIEQRLVEAALGKRRVLHGRLLASVSPADKELAARWTMPASTPSERATMIAGMKAEVPPEALLGLMTMLRPRVDAAGWAKLARAAGLGD